MADDVSRADLDMLTWLLTWTDDVIRLRQQLSSARVKRVLSPPTRGGAARSPGGAWRRVRHRLNAIFLQ